MIESIGLWVVLGFGVANLVWWLWRGSAGNAFAAGFCFAIFFALYVGSS